MTDYLLCIDGMEGESEPLSFPPQHLKMTGTVRTVPAGAVPDSLGCILRLLGAQEAELPSGRAAWEAMACGIPVTEHDAFFRCTLCGCDTDGRLYPVPPEAAERVTGILAQKQSRTLPEGWCLHQMSGYRSLLRIENAAKRLGGVHTEPPHQHYGADYRTCLPEGGLLGRRLRQFIADCAAQIPGYVLLPWGQSAYRPLFTFAGRTGVRAGMVCSAEIVRGLSLALGIACPIIPGTTADVDTDLQAKYWTAKQLARRYPLVILHINGCDEAGHRRDAVQKAAFLNRIRRELLIPILDTLRPGERLLLCSDHQTQSATGKHGTAPVHFWIYENGFQGKASVLPLISAQEPLRLLLDRGRD
ncbi:hypothetical protein LI291_12540 [Intestinibacillus massiliensis]|nr:hypothetical protein [Intestinibacillus massiliensis]